MITVKFSLEYNCYPIWMYDEDGIIIDNDLPTELSNDKELDGIMLEVQKMFDSQYIDNDKSFQFVGFKNESEKSEFTKMANTAVAMISSRLGKGYEFECDEL